MDLLTIARVLFAIGMTLFCNSILAQDNGEAEIIMKTPIFIASPNVCELKKGTYLCEMKAALIWEMPKAGHYCLYEKDDVTPLQCWKNNWSGSHVLTFQSDKPVTYVLKMYQHPTVVSEVTINVIGTLEQRIRAKRRRGFLRIF